MTSDTTKPPHGRREARKQDKRQAIIDAARISFLNDGYAATSMSGLLATLGGSKATLWGYFRSKEELFAAVMEDVTAVYREELEGGLKRSAGLEETLVAFCTRFMHKTATPDAVAAWRLIVGESGRFPELGRIFYDKAPQRVELALSEYLTFHIAEGNLCDESPDHMAQLLIGLCGTLQSRRVWGLAAEMGTGDLDSDARRFAAYFLRLFGTGKEDAVGSAK